MPDPKDISGGRDYGRRLYTSDLGYAAQMRRQTDAFVNRYGKRAHSEDKKPYLEDLDYPEMEHFHFPWDDPRWPSWDPPTEPDTPGGSVDPPTIRPYWPPKPPPGPFLGCFFNPPRFSPFVASPGETAYTQIAVADGDYIIGWEADGPITILSNFGHVNNCRSELRAKCHVIVRVNDDAASTPNSGLIHAFVNVQLASGQRCSAEIIIKPCTGVIPVEWDWANSPQTIAAPGSATIYILDGQPPFTWKVAGSGFTLASARTDVRANTLSATVASCGTAKISVKDACGNQTVGEVRSISGAWVFVGNVCLANCLGAIPDGANSATIGGQKCQQVYGLTSAGSCTAGSCGAGIGDGCGDCSSPHDCEALCASESAAPGCIECLKWQSTTLESFPCYAENPCSPPNGKYRLLACWRSTSLEAWEWRCSP